MYSVLSRHAEAFTVSSTASSFSCLFFHRKRASEWVMILIFDWNIAFSNSRPDSCCHHLFSSVIHSIIRWFIHLTDTHLMLSMWQVLPLELGIHKNGRHFLCYTFWMIALHGNAKNIPDFWKTAYQLLRFWDGRYLGLDKNEERNTLWLEHPYRLEES